MKKSVNTNFSKNIVKEFKDNSESYFDPRKVVEDSYNQAEIEAAIRENCDSEEEILKFAATAIDKEKSMVDSTFKKSLIDVLSRFLAIAVKFESMKKEHNLKYGSNQ